MARTCGDAVCLGMSVTLSTALSLYFMTLSGFSTVSWAGGLTFLKYIVDVVSICRSKCERFLDLDSEPDSFCCAPSSQRGLSLIVNRGAIRWAPFVLALVVSITSLFFVSSDGGSKQTSLLLFVVSNILFLIQAHFLILRLHPDNEYDRERLRVHSMHSDPLLNPNNVVPIARNNETET